MIKYILEIKDTGEHIGFIRTPILENPTEEEIAFAQTIVTLLELSSLFSSHKQSLKALNPSPEFINAIRKQCGMKGDL